MSYRGRCACGAVTASIDGTPVAIRQCWCRQCQQVAAGSPTNNAIFATDEVTISGLLAENAYIAASRNTLTHSFCPSCGTPVMARSSARPEYRTLRLGFLEPGHGLQPTVAIWIDDAPEWAAIDTAIEQVARQPAPPLPRA